MNNERLFHSQLKKKKTRNERALTIIISITDQTSFNYTKIKSSMPCNNNIQR